MSLYQQILDKSESVNALEFKDKITFQVPKNHPRYKKIKSYDFSKLKLEKIALDKLYIDSKNKIFIVDKEISKLNFVNEFLKDKEKYILPSIENKVKTKSFIDNLIK